MKKEIKKDYTIIIKIADSNTVCYTYHHFGTLKNAKISATKNANRFYSNTDISIVLTKTKIKFETKPSIMVGKSICFKRHFFPVGWVNCNL